MQGIELQLEKMNVPRGTIPKLQRYAELLLSWNAKINLISKKTEAELWDRHILDSLSLLPYLSTESGPVVDFGSGAGLPGLLLALCRPGDWHLIEVDQKKAAFLRTAAHDLGIKCVIHSARIETVPPLHATTAVARACAPLEKLLGFAKRHVQPSGTLVFHKGQAVAEEIHRARKDWTFTAQPHIVCEKTHNTILVVKEWQRVGSGFNDDKTKHNA